MFRRFFKFFLAAICIVALAPLAMACGGEDGPPPTPFTGAWVLKDEADPITDKGYISICLDASDDDVAGAYTPQLVVQCHDAETFNVYVAWGKTLTATSERTRLSFQDERRSYVDIAWRVDDDEAQTGTWILDGSLTFAPPSKWYNTPAVDDLREADKISVRVFNKVSGYQATAVFRTAGFGGAFEPIRQACRTR